MEKKALRVLQRTVVSPPWIYEGILRRRPSQASLTRPPQTCCSVQQTWSRIQATFGWRAMRSAPGLKSYGCCVQLVADFLGGEVQQDCRAACELCGEHPLADTVMRAASALQRQKKEQGFSAGSKAKDWAGTTVWGKVRVLILIGEKG
eukprot:scaffold57358_cov18-Tisochrysis_lutea.AAC.1